MLFDRVSDLCKSNNITIWKLEKELNFANASVSRWKKAYPSADRLSKVADYFGVSVDYLLGRPATSPQGQELASAFDDLPAAKRDLVKRYVEMLKSE